jgi:hypothetical protein
MTDEPQTLPLSEPLNDGFDQPKALSAAQRAFPANVVGTLMPLHADIPTDYPDRAEWEKFVSHWFFQGDPFAKWDLLVRPDVDGNTAFTHLRALMGSYEPKHEHKEAAVAWLASRWFAAIRPKATA